MAVKNIEMNYRTESGYEVLYPQVQMNNIISWNNYVYSKSQIDSTVSGLNSSISSKANQSDLNTLSQTVSQKANQSDLNNVSAVAGSKLIKQANAVFNGGDIHIDLTDIEWKNYFMVSVYFDFSSILTEYLINLETISGNITLRYGSNKFTSDVIIQLFPYFDEENSLLGLYFPMNIEYGNNVIYMEDKKFFNLTEIVVWSYSPETGASGLVNFYGLC